ncbi:MAG: hypothetical protein RLZZ450_1241 [Pseudomonadota bacterium]|jgi:Spy/CpxP family protein refolding chaperone
MVGLIVGAVCAAGLFAALRRRHYYRYGFGGWGRHDLRASERWGDDYERGFSRFRDGPCGGGFRRHGRRGGPRRLLRGLFARLDTTPGQEKAIANSLYEAGERMRELRGGLRLNKRELAALIGSDVLDVTALEALLAQYQTAFDRVRSEVVTTVSTIHEALDTEQRRELSELLADGSLSSVFRRGPF